jgi:hypothetical protein
MLLNWKKKSEKIDYFIEKNMWQQLHDNKIFNEKNYFQSFA